MLEHNGKMYARVTEILSSFNDFGHINPDVLANKARIGTDVHKAIANDIEGDFPFVSRECERYFHSYSLWRAALNPTFIQSEQRYFCDIKMITGQIDCLVKFPDKFELPILVDFKTSSAESKETWPMQAHLYRYLLLVNNILVSDRFLFIKLNKFGGLPEVFSYQYDHNIQAKCMQAVHDFWEKNNK